MDELEPDVSKVINNVKIGEISDPFVSLDDKQRQVYKIIKVLNKHRRILPIFRKIINI